MFEILIIIFGALSIACTAAALWLARREVREANDTIFFLREDLTYLRKEVKVCEDIIDIYKKLYTDQDAEITKLTQELSKYKRKRDSHGRFVS